MQTLKIIPRSSSFYIDDIIEGQVELTTSVQIIINDINIALNISEYWTTYSKEAKSNISEDRTQPLITQDLNVKSKLDIKTNLVAIKAGKFTFDFKLKPNKILEPSFEFPGKVDKAYIRYFLSSDINSPYIKGSAKTFIIIKKRQKIEMNKNVIITSEISVYKWGLFNSGKTKLKVTSVNGTDNFKFGEDVKFEIDVDNTNGKLITNECRVTFQRNIKFNNSYGQLKKDILDKLSKQTIKTGSTPGEHKTFPCVLSLKKIENKNFVLEGSDIPYTNFPDINYFLPSVKTVVLECSYSIKFTLYFNKFVKYNDRPRIIMNAIMCHQSIDEYKAEMDKKLNMNRSKTLTNSNNNLYPPTNIGPPRLAPPHMMPPSMMPSNMAPPPMTRPNLAPPSMMPPSKFPRTLTNPTLTPPSLAPPSMMPPSMMQPPMKPPSLAPPSMMPPSMMQPPMKPPSLAPPSMMPPQMAPPQASPTSNDIDNIDPIQKMIQNFNDLYNIVSGDNISVADVIIFFPKLWNSITGLGKVINLQDENIHKINQSYLNLKSNKKVVDILSEDEKGQIIIILNLANTALITQINAKRSSFATIPLSMMPQNQNMMPPNMIPQNQNMMPQEPNMLPSMDEVFNQEHQKNMSGQTNNGIPPQEFNHMNNNNMNNVQEDELPSMEEIQGENNMNNNS